MTELYPPFQAKVDQLLELAKAYELPVGVHMGLRTFDQQDGLYALGRTVKNPDGFDAIKKPLGNIVTRAKGGESWHNYGLAVDIVFKIGPKQAWSWDGKLPWERLGALGGALKFQWGGLWKARDLPHFQWDTGFSVREALALYKDGGLQRVWDKLGGEHV